ncbi:MAG: hypothetical protein ACFCU6_14520 [Balneolaceae bacterium]
MDEEIIKNLHDELEDVIDETERRINNAAIEERLNELKTEAELFIRKYPVRSVLAGAAIGFLIGKILKS